MTRLKIGIVGQGKMGRIRRQVLEQMPEVQVVAVCDPALEGSPTEERGVHVSDDFDAFLSIQPQAIVICTPNDVTAEFTARALDAGAHVFAEKPPGRDLSETRAILDTAGRHPQQIIKFGFNHRYHDSVIQAHSIVQSGSLGDVLWMRGVYGKSGGVGFEETWRSDHSVAGGGILLDQGIHMLDLFRLFGGEFDDVRSMVVNRFWPIEVEDNVFALLRNSAGLTALLHSSSTHWKHTFSLDICLTEGHLTLDGILSGSGSYGPETLRVSRRQFEDEATALGKPRQEVIYFDTDHSWRRELQEFIDCILRDKPVRVGTLRDAWKTMELVFKIYAADERWQHAGSASEELAEAKNQPMEWEDER